MCLPFNQPTVTQLHRPQRHKRCIIDRLCFRQHLVLHFTGPRLLHELIPLSTHHKQAAQGQRTPKESAEHIAWKPLNHQCSDSKKQHRRCQRKDVLVCQFVADLMTSKAAQHDNSKRNNSQTAKDEMDCHEQRIASPCCCLSLHLSHNRHQFVDCCC